MSLKTMVFQKRSNHAKELADFFFNKDILITGGCGSIGSEIVKQLIAYSPKRIRVFDNNESGLFHLQEKLCSPLLRVLVGDIRDKERLRLAARGCDIIFHAAALKHVPLCEYNPFEAVHTNVIGTQNLIEVARDEQVKKMVAISTDKAANPINTMGATKLLAEKLIMTADIGEHCVTKFSCVRFGNVLNSVGSVIPIFKEQIQRGGPVTITSLEMTRFFMTMEAAVKLVLKSAVLSRGGEVFILKMKRLKVIDLAEAMISTFGPKYGHDPEKIDLKIIGVRPGEKLHEILVTEEERNHLLDAGDLYVIRQAKLLPKYQRGEKKIPEGSGNGDINDGVFLTKEQIADLLDTLHITL